MPKLDLIYVTTGRHPATEKIICEATNSIYSHAAIGITINGEYKIIESVRPSVHMAQGDIFDNCPVKQVISLPITESQQQAVILKARKLVGTKYGVDDCVVSGLNKIFGEQAAALADKLIDNEQTIQCSGLQINLVREAFPDFAGECPGNYFTPEQARQSAIEYAKRLGVRV